MADQRKTLQPLIAELEAELRETETVGPEAEMERLESELRVLKAVDLDVEEANLQEKLKASKAAMESNKGALAEKQGIVEALEGSIITLQGQLQEAEAKAAAPVVDDPSTTPEQEEAERLQAELKATELARQIAEARAEELQLELEERELTAAEARAAKEASEAQAGPSRVKEYQSAIQALNKMSMEEKGRLERRLGELERDAGTKARLKRQVSTVCVLLVLSSNCRQKFLQYSIGVSMCPMNLDGRKRASKPSVLKTLGFRGLVEALVDCASVRFKNARVVKMFLTFVHRETQEPLTCRIAFSKAKGVSNGWLSKWEVFEY